LPKPRNLLKELFCQERLLSTHD